MNLKRIDSVAQIEKGMAAWAKKFKVGALPVLKRGSGVFYHPTLKVWALFEPRSATKFKFYNVFGIDPSSFEHNKVVQFIPRTKDYAGAGLLAVDDQGRTWALHSGLMQARWGRVSTGQFSRTAGLGPPAKIALKDGRVGRFYPVTCLDFEPAVVQSQTAAFVHACNRVRLAFGRTDDPEELDEMVEALLSGPDDEISTDDNDPPLPPERRSGTASRFVRNPRVVATVYRGAKGRCEACDTHVTWVNDRGRPWLEVHHVRPLAEGGPDIRSNAVALCPDCHRRLHHSSDRSEYRGKLIEKVERLQDFPMVKV